MQSFNSVRSVIIATNWKHQTIWRHRMHRGRKPDYGDEIEIVELKWTSDTTTERKQSWTQMMKLARNAAKQLDMVLRTYVAAPRSYHRRLSLPCIGSFSQRHQKSRTTVLWMTKKVVLWLQLVLFMFTILCFKFNGKFCCWSCNTGLVSFALVNLV